MSVKKILLLSSAGVAAVSMTAAMAGGFTHEPTAPVAENGYYIEGHAGYARQNYFDNTNWRAATHVDTNTNNNARGGFSAGVDAGYKINRHFAVELGWFHLPDVRTNAPGSVGAYFSSWVLYLAGKYMCPLPWMNNTEWFFKMGVSYRDAELSAASANALATNYTVSKRDSTFVRPMFATGLDYSFSDAWSGVMQYAYFMGARNSFPFTTANAGAMGTVAANVFTLGLAYKFTV